jgi:hypothetical protein
VSKIEAISGRIASDSSAPNREARTSAARRSGAVRNDHVIPNALQTTVARGSPARSRTAGTDHKSSGVRSAGGVSQRFSGKLWQIGKLRFPQGISSH